MTRTPVDTVAASGAQDVAEKKQIVQIRAVCVDSIEEVVHNPEDFEVEMVLLRQKVV